MALTKPSMCAARPLIALQSVRLGRSVLRNPGAQPVVTLRCVRLGRLLSRCLAASAARPLTALGLMVARQAAMAQVVAGLTVAAGCSRRCCRGTP